MADLTLTRRSMLFGLAALLAAPVKVAIPSLPEIAPGPRRWLWVHASGWHETPSMLDRVLQFTAQRSDGEYFYVAVAEHIEDMEAAAPEAIARLIQLDIENAKLTLDDFLNCECKAEKPCDRHTPPPMTEEELAELRESLA